MLEIILMFVIPLITAIITAVVTVRLSLHQFYSQKWWEKKSEAYANIIRHLARLQYCFLEWGDEVDSLRVDNRNQQLREEYAVARERVIQVAIESEYFVSGETNRLLKDLRNELYNPNADFEDYSAIVDKCLIHMKKLAQKDLKVEVCRKERMFV